MHLDNSTVFHLEPWIHRVPSGKDESHAQNNVSRFSKLSEPMGREDHRFLSPQLSNPREQIYPTVGHQFRGR